MTKTVEPLMVTVPIGLRDRCKAAAAAEHRNLSNFVSLALAKYLEMRAQEAPDVS